MSSPADIHGSCLCGQVQYTLTGGLPHNVLCHCKSCRKSSGSSFMANSWFDSSNVAITKGEDVIKWYNDTSPDSGRALKRGFCANCGSSLFALAPDLFPTKTVVMSGTMDGVQGKDASIQWAPAEEYYSKDKAKWYSNENTKLS